MGDALRRLICSSRGIASEDVDGTEVDKLFSVFKVELDKLTGKMNTEIKGTSSVFSQLRARGIKVFVGSGFPDPVVQAIVKNMEWSVDGALSSDALGAGRPDPIMVTKAMELGGVSDKNRVVKVGDTVVDIEEGRNAGVSTVAVLTGTQSKDKLQAAGPDCIIDSVADFIQLSGAK